MAASGAGGGGNAAEDSPGPCDTGAQKPKVYPKGWFGLMKGPKKLLASKSTVFHTVFRHAHTSCILKTTAQCCIGIGVGTAGFYSNHYFFTDTGKIFCHFIPAGKHA